MRSAEQITDRKPIRNEIIIGRRKKNQKIKKGLSVYENCSAIDAVIVVVSMEWTKSKCRQSTDRSAHFHSFQLKFIHFVVGFGFADIAYLSLKEASQCHRCIWFGRMCSTICAWLEFQLIIAASGHVMVCWASFSW